MKIDQGFMANVGRDPAAERFLAALLTFGIDRILFSVDYPYAPNARGQAFLKALSVSPADLAKLAHGNADRLLGLKVKAA